MTYAYASLNSWRAYAYGRYTRISNNDGYKYSTVGFTCNQISFFLMQNHIQYKWHSLSWKFPLFICIFGTGRIIKLNVEFWWLLLNLDGLGLKVSCQTCRDGQTRMANKSRKRQTWKGQYLLSAFFKSDGRLEDNK